MNNRYDYVMKQEDGDQCAITVMCTLAEEAVKNKPLCHAIAALGRGFHCEKLCGALSAATCSMAMILNDHKQGVEAEQQLFTWFEDEFGSTECRDLRSRGNCQEIVLRTIAMANEIIELNKDVCQDDIFE